MVWFVRFVSLSFNFFSFSISSCCRAFIFFFLSRGRCRCCCFNTHSVVSRHIYSMCRPLVRLAKRHILSLPLICVEEENQKSQTHWVNGFVSVFTRCSCFDLESILFLFGDGPEVDGALKGAGGEAFCPYVCFAYIIIKHIRIIRAFDSWDLQFCLLFSSFLPFGTSRHNNHQSSSSSLSLHTHTIADTIYIFRYLLSGNNGSCRARVICDRVEVVVNFIINKIHLWFMIVIIIISVPFTTYYLQSS